MRNRIPKRKPVTNSTTTGSKAAGSAYAVSAASAAAVSKGSSYLSLPTKRTTNKHSRLRVGQKKGIKLRTGKTKLSSAKGGNVGGDDGGGDAQDIAQALQSQSSMRTTRARIGVEAAAGPHEPEASVPSPRAQAATIIDSASEAMSSDSAREVESVPTTVGAIGQQHFSVNSHADPDDATHLDIRNSGGSSCASSAGDDMPEEFDDDDEDDDDDDDDDDEDDDIDDIDNYSVAHQYSPEHDDTRNEPVVAKHHHRSSNKRGKRKAAAAGAATKHNGRDSQHNQQSQRQVLQLPLPFTASTQQLVGGQDKHAKLWQDIAQLQQESDGTAMALKRKTKKLRVAQAKAADLEKRHQMDRRRVERLLHRIAFLEKTQVGTSSELQRAQQNLATEQHAHRALVQQTDAAQAKARESVQQLTSDLATSEALKLGLEEKTVALQAELDASNSSVREDQSKRAAEREEHTQTQKRLQTQLDMMRAEVERLSLQKEEVSRHLWHASDESKTLKATIARLEEQSEERTKQSKDALAGLEQSKEAIDAANTRAAAEHTRADKLQVQLDDTCKELAQLQDQFANLEGATAQQLKDKDATVEQYANEATTAKQLCEDIRAEMATQSRQAESHAQTLRQAAQVLQENHLKDAVKLEKELKSAQAAQASAEAQYKSLESETKEIRRQHKVNSAQTRQDRQRIKVLESDLAKAREESSNLKKTELEHVSARARTEAALNALQTVRDRDVKAMRVEVSAVKEECKTATAAMEAAQGAAEATLQDVREELKLAVRRAEDLSKDLETLKNTYKSSKEAWNEQEAELRAALDSTVARLSELEGGQSQQLEDIRKELDSKTALCEEVTKEKAGLLHDCGRMNDELAEARAERKQVEVKLRESYDRLNGAMEELQQAKSQTTSAAEELATLRDKTNTQAQEHIQARKELRGVIDELKGEVKLAQRTAAEQVMAFGKGAEDSRLEIEALKQSKQELEGRVEMQEKGAKEAVKARQALEQELSNLHQKYQIDTETLQLRVDQARTELAAVEQQRREMEAGVAESERLSTKLKELRASLRDRDQGLNQTQKELLAAKAECEEEVDKVNNLRKELLIRKQDYHNVTSELATLKADRGTMEREARVREAKLNKEIAEAKHLAQSKQGDVDRSNRMLEQVQRKFERVQEAANQTVKNLMEEANKSQEAYEQDLALMRNEIRTQHNKFLDLKNDMTKETKALRSERAGLEERVDSLERRRDELTVEKGKLSEEVERKVADAEAVAEELEVATQAVDGLERRLAQKEVTLANLEKQLQVERDNKGDLKRSLAEQEAQTLHNLETERELNAKLKAEVQANARDKDWIQNDCNIKLSALQRQMGNLKGDLQRKSEELVACQLRMQEAQEQAQAAEAQLSKQVLEMREAQRVEANARQAMLDKARKEGVASAKRVAQLEAQASEFNAQLRDVQVKLEQAEEYSVNRRDAALSLGKRVKLLEQTKRKLEVEMKKLKNNGGGGTGGGGVAGEGAKALEEALDERDKTIAALRGAHSQETERLRSQIDTLRDAVAGVASSTAAGVGVGVGVGVENGPEHHHHHVDGTSSRSSSVFEGRLRAVQSVARTYFDATQGSPPPPRPLSGGQHSSGGGSSGSIGAMVQNTERRRRSSSLNSSSSSIASSSEGSGAIRPLPRAPAPVTQQQQRAEGVSSSDLIDRTSEFLAQRRGSAEARQQQQQQQQQRGLLPDGTSMEEADRLASQLQASAATASVTMVPALSTTTGDGTNPSTNDNSERILPYVNSARGGVRR